MNIDKNDGLVYCVEINQKKTKAKNFYLHLKLEYDHQHE
jgi:hypothetical protein